MNYGIEKFVNRNLVGILESSSKDNIMRHWKRIKTLKSSKKADIVFYLVKYRGCSTVSDAVLDIFVPEEL